jgi:dTDP-glucose 4,6-dehydratase
MIKIVVTGGMGFIGSHFVNKLKGSIQDCEITVIDKLTYASNVNNINCDINFIKEDICNLSELPKCDYIVHFAAESHVDNSIKDGRPFVRTNVEGTFNMVELALKVDGLKKFIHISTDEVYGDMIDYGSDILSNEDFSLVGSSYYSATKASSDLIVQSAGRTFGLPYIITRTCNNFGENQHSEKMVPKIIKMIKNDEPIPVYGDGEQIREWIHADDNAQSIINIMLSDEVNQVFNIGSGYRITNNQLIKIVSEIVGKDVNFNYVEDRLGHDRKYALDISKYTDRFGKLNYIDLKEWLTKIIKK